MEETYELANDQEKLGKALIRITLAGFEYSDLGITEDIEEISEHLSRAAFLMGRHFNEANQEKFIEWLNKKSNEYRTSAINRLKEIGL